MLCESLMLLLIEEGTLHKQRAMDAIETVIDVKQEIAGTTESVVVSMESIVLLRTVAQSISAATTPTAPVSFAPTDI